jgi:translation initiation factor 1
MPDANIRRVYSSDTGRVREGLVRPPARPSVRGAQQPHRPTDPADGTLRIRREKGGRGGKTVTTVTGTPGSDADLAAMLKALKQLCGAGGSLDGRVIEIQGDHRERVRAHLEAQGHVVKMAGG